MARYNLTSCPRDNSQSSRGSWRPGGQRRGARNPEPRKPPPPWLGQKLRRPGLSGWAAVGRHEWVGRSRTAPRHPLPRGPPRVCPGGYINKGPRKIFRGKNRFYRKWKLWQRNLRSPEPGNPRTNEAKPPPCQGVRLSRRRLLQTPLSRRRLLQTPLSRRRLLQTSR